MGLGESGINGIQPNGTGALEGCSGIHRNEAGSLEGVGSVRCNGVDDRRNRGNDDDGDACLNICRVAVCSDEVVREGVEECDDGNAGDGNAGDTDACLSTCVGAVCGDGIVQDGVEACDDGNDIDDDACSPTVEESEAFTPTDDTNIGGDLP